jgi:hypothetical protein
VVPLPLGLKRELIKQRRHARKDKINELETTRTNILQNCTDI